MAAGRNAGYCSIRRAGSLDWTYYPLSTLPAPYDIVWCRFPYVENIGEPGPKSRPALVRNTAVVDDRCGEVEVVFGTTNLADFRRIDDFYITKNSAMDACGLYRATRFDLDRCSWLPWASEWFAPLPGFASPVIGTLDSGSIRSLQTTVAYTEARRAKARDSER